jgi:hypothetical protein
MAGKRQEVAAAGSAIANCEVRWVRGDHDLHAQYPDLVGGLVHSTPERADPVAPKTSGISQPPAGRDWVVEEGREA